MFAELDYIPYLAITGLGTHLDLHGMQMVLVQSSTDMTCFSKCFLSKARST